MCGRYYIEIEDKDMQEIIAAVERNTQIRTGEIFPTNVVPVISSGGKDSAMQWGFPHFSGKGQIINARSETASVKPTFRHAMNNGRCLIPSSWYFEWQTNGTKKIKHQLTLPEKQIMYLAGLSRTDNDGTFRFAILTRPVWTGIAYIHDRMPVILPNQIHDE